MKHFVFLFLAAIYSTFGFSQYFSVTTTEASSLQSTSTYNDVMEFIRMQEKASKLFRVETIATSVEGSSILLLEVAYPVPKSSREVGNWEVVYIQANIRTGEIEGKDTSCLYATC